MHITLLTTFNRLYTATLFSLMWLDFIFYSSLYSYKFVVHESPTPSAPL